MPIKRPAIHFKTPLPFREEGYDGNTLINGLQRRYAKRNDADLARMLWLSPAIICKIRKNRLGISAQLILRIHDITGLSISEIRQLAGVPEPHYPSEDDYAAVFERKYGKAAA